MKWQLSQHKSYCITHRILKVFVCTCMLYVNFTEEDVWFNMNLLHEIQDIFFIFQAICFYACSKVYFFIYSWPWNIKWQDWKYKLFVVFIHQSQNFKLYGRLRQKALWGRIDQNHKWCVFPILPVNVPRLYTCFIGSSDALWYMLLCTVIDQVWTFDVDIL